MDYYKKERANNLPSKTKEPTNWKNVWVFTFVLLLLVSIIVFLYLYTEKQLRVKDYYSGPAVGLHHNINDGLPNKIYAYSGKLLNIKNNILTIAIAKADNYILQNKEIIVTVNKNTKYRKFIAPTTIPNLKPGESGNYYERTDITLNKIKPGNQITVIANENIKNKTKFIAAIVEVHGK